MVCVTYLFFFFFKSLAASILKIVAPTIQIRRGLTSTEKAEEINGVKAVTLSYNLTFAFIKKSRKPLDIWQFVRDYNFDIYVKSPVVNLTIFNEF